MPDRTSPCIKASEKLTISYNLARCPFAVRACAIVAHLRVRSGEARTVRHGPSRGKRNDLNNRAYKTSPAQCSLWNRKQTRLRPEMRRMLIGLSERVLGASLVSLELKGFPAQLVVDGATARQIVDEWRRMYCFSTRASAARSITRWCANCARPPPTPAGPSSR